MHVYLYAATVTDSIYNDLTTVTYCGAISVTVLVTLYELVIHPIYIFHRLIPNVKIPYKICIGALLHLSRIVLLLTLVTYARHSFIDSETSGNYFNIAMSIPRASWILTNMP